MRRRLSTTTRSGSFAGSSGCRTVSCGSSASTVPIPTRTASAANRRRWPSRRAASPVIHRDVPSTAAILPSSVIAALRVTCGRPSRHGAEERAIQRGAPRPPGRPSSPPRRRLGAAPAPRPSTARFGSPVGRHHPSDARPHERVRARRRAAEMSARLERDVARRAARRRAGGVQRHDLGVRSSRPGDARPRRRRARP